MYLNLYTTLLPHFRVFFVFFLPCHSPACSAPLPPPHRVISTSHILPKNVPLKHYFRNKKTGIYLISASKDSSFVLSLFWLHYLVSLLPTEVNIIISLRCVYFTFRPSISFSFFFFRHGENEESGRDVCKASCGATGAARLCHTDPVSQAFV